MRVHLDTDLAGDPDDACALAMLLGWPGIELVGITTTADPGGRRAGYVIECLRLAGKLGIPVAAGAEVSLTTMRRVGEIPDDTRYWPSRVRARPSPPGAALDLLDRSIEQGATIAAIGPFTNLALLETVRPGRLGAVPVVLMGGWVRAPATNLPAWGPEDDWNVQCDPRAVEILAPVGTLTLVPLAATLETHLRVADLPRLRASGPLGELLASQSRAHADDYGMAKLGRAYARLPDDLVNFHHDPLACAVAVGWSGAVVEAQRVRLVRELGPLHYAPDDSGHTVRVVTDVDGEAFSEAWLTAVEAAQARP